MNIAQNIGKIWGNAGLGWDLWCTLGYGPEIGKTNFVLGVGGGNVETGTGQALFTVYHLYHTFQSQKTSTENYFKMHFKI